MLFGTPKEYKEQGIDIVIEKEEMLEGKKEIDSEQEDIDDIQKTDKENIGKEYKEHILESLAHTGFRGLYFSNPELNYLNERTIQSFRQNIPELIIIDCIREFNLDDEQAEKLRIILMARGVNKWMLARREFLKLRDIVKDMLKCKEGMCGDRRVHKIIEDIYVKMQCIAKMPRWVEWPINITHKWNRIEKDIKIKGRRTRITVKNNED